MSGRRRRVALAAGLAATLASGGCVQHVVTRIDGGAMWPTLDHGDRIVMTRLVGAPARGDVVGLRDPKDPAKRFVMRIVGMPRERVAIVGGVVHIDGRALAEPEDQ